MDIGGFASNLKTRGYSPRTIEAYQRELGKFQTYLRHKRLRITQVSAKVVMDYIASDELEQLARASVQRRMAAISCYFGYLEQTSDGRIKNPVKVIRRPRKQAPNPKPVDPAVIDRLLAVVDNARDRAIIRLFASSGLRLAELASLDRDSIQVERLQHGAGTRILGIGTVVGKGGKEREFLVDAAALTYLGEYLRERGVDDVPALFLSNRKQRLSTRTIEHLVRSWSLKVRLDHPIHPHQLRHSMATALHRAGVDLSTISKLLGHSSISITEKYVKPDLSRIRAEYFAAMALTEDL
jgi:integrase/recombinase XerC